MPAILRVVRPTADLEAILPFYVDGLGFETLYRVENQDGFDAAILGHPGHPYHFAFTHYRAHKAGRAPGQDNLLVFYLPERAAYDAALARMAAAGFAAVPSFNPYWDEGGATFEDPDGYRVVLTSRTWIRQAGAG
ncbi:MAG TPA: VOC family protein [Dongiaceae bacterium]|jgi:catechol 2,3-dioxygenase-like lactoylglutathione lyase family enzyme